MFNDVAELKAKLAQMRADNRKMNVQNLNMMNEIADINAEIKQMNQQKAELEKKYENEKKAIDEELELDSQTKSNMRLERRKTILSDIRKITDENRSITNDIKSISDDIGSIGLKRKVQQHKQVANQVLTRRAMKK